MHVKPGTARMLFRADTPWEGNAITEGPVVVKIGKKYVLSYSGRAFWDPDYAVGYALADTPEGPWRESASNPILRRVRGPPPAAPICNYDSPPKRDFDILFLFKK